MAHRVEETSKIRKRGITFLFCVIFGLIGLFIFAGSRSNLDPEAWKNLTRDKSRCSGQLQIAQRQGLIQEVKSNAPGETQVFVDERAWEDSLHKDKLASILAVYCLNGGPEGKHSVYAKGVRDGKIKATIIDGQYFSR